LIVLAVLNIYRKYYGVKIVGFLLFAFYVPMAGASLIVDVLFGLVGLIPKSTMRGWPLSAGIIRPG
jgi:hypothetical protein